MAQAPILVPGLEPELRYAACPLRYTFFNVDRDMPLDLAFFINAEFALAGIFAASLELSKEGVLSVSQKKIFDKLFIKKNSYEK